MAVSREEIELSLAKRKKLLVVLNDGDLISTQKRILRLVYHLTKANFQIDVMVHSEEVFDQVEESFAENDRVKVLYQKAKSLYWQPQRRDDFVKIFINQVSNIVIPGTELPYWKTAAFDDFRGHISAHVFDDIKKDYELVAISVPSNEEAMVPEADVLSTSVLFQAKEAGIKLVGLQIYPAQHCPRVYMNMLDYIVVRNEAEKEHYINEGFNPNNLRIPSDIKDNYCLDVIEDTYKNLMFDREIEVAEDELSILILNHARYRSQMKEAIDMLAEMDIKKCVCFAKAGYEIRELSEEDIFDELIKPSLEKLKSNYYIIDNKALAKMLMMFDVVISSTYTSPVRFAASYGKGAIVYNPIKCSDSVYEGIKFCGEADSLKEKLYELYEKKCSQKSIGRIFEDLCT